MWLLAAWLTLAGNVPLWLSVHALGGSPAQRLASFAGLGLLAAGSIAALLSLTAWPRLFRPVASALALVSALNTHFMLSYGVVIDAGMLANVVHTDAREVRDLMSWTLLATVLLIAGGPLWWIWRRPVRWSGWLGQAGRNAAGVAASVALIGVVVLLAYQDLASLMRNHKSLRYMINPLNAVYAATRVAAREIPRPASALLPVGEDAAPGASHAPGSRPPLLLLVIGETARAKNFGLNGYARQTTPALARWEAGEGLLNFGAVESCGTSTQVSLPCMFSPLSRAQGGDSAPERENLLDVLQRAGFAVQWIDNQAGCKGVCDRVPSASTVGRRDPGLCDGDECFDEVMLGGLDERLAALDPARRARGVVLVMHQMGSHGPAYFRRTPAQHKRYLPECASSTLSDCSPAELVNAYDNTVAYTDRFLGGALEWLRERERSGANATGLLYVSDHGESLGENGLYLHGMPRALAPREQIHVPMVVWLSPALRARARVDLDCLRRRSRLPHSHDHLFHTVLGAMDVTTRAYDRSLDLLAPCAGSQAGRFAGSAVPEGAAHAEGTKSGSS